MGITLWSLKTYEYIDSKIKSYQILKGFFLQFIFYAFRLNFSGFYASSINKLFC